MCAGSAAIRAVYRHMFETLEQPHFVVEAILVASARVLS